jgi:hypothetical protein
MPDDRAHEEPSGGDCCARSGEVIVLPREGGREQVRSLLASADIGGEVLYSTEDVLGRYAELPPRWTRVESFPLPVFPAHPVLVSVAPGTERQAAERLATTPGVSAALPNHLVQPSAPSVTLHLPAIDAALTQVLGRNGAQPGCGEGIRVAVLDTGIDPTVVGDEAVEPIQYDADRPRPTADYTPFDPVGHGSVVAYIVHRIAPEARLTSVKVTEASGDLMGLVAGLYLAHAYVRPHVYNLSVGVTRHDSAACPHCGRRTRTPHAAWQIAQVLSAFRGARAPGDPDPVFVAAGGNWTSRLLEPAAIAPAIAVGAYDRAADAQPAYSRYSRIPPDRFLLAPGGDNADDTCFARDGSRSYGPKRTFGTSFAAPFVTGLAARYLCRDCGLGARAPVAGGQTDADVVRACLQASADTGIAGYRPDLHGFGFARWDDTVLDRVLSSLPA